ncbi:MAG: 2OG-Fe(II) oxygenase [Hyphomicrobiaceae bacterium]
MAEHVTSAGEHLLGALNQARHHSQPFNYWLLDDILPEDLIDGIAALPFAPPGASVLDGRRESNNSTRVYFTPENQKKFAVCRDTAEAFGSDAVVNRIEELTDAHLNGARLRIEYCQDVDGFWLEPHVDIAVKRFTMLVYLSGESDLAAAGTDIYDASPEHNLVASAPYEKNKGLIFIPGADTWHGFSRRPIAGVRKSIIINWVAPEWRDTWELC